MIGWGVLVSIGGFCKQPPKDETGCNALKTPESTLRLMEEVYSLLWRDPQYKSVSSFRKQMGFGMGYAEVFKESSRPKAFSNDFTTSQLYPVDSLNYFIGTSLQNSTPRIPAAAGVFGAAPFCRTHGTSLFLTGHGIHPPKRTGRSARTSRTQVTFTLWP